MKNVLFFDTMIMPKVIVLIYWLLLVVSLGAGLFTLFQGAVIYGVLVAVGGAVGARLYCELMIVLFKINDNLQRIADSKTTPPTE